MDILVTAISPSNKILICTGNWEIDTHMYVQERKERDNEWKETGLEYVDLSEYRPLYSLFSSYTFKDQIPSVNTAKQQSHFVLKLLLFRMKNTICNQIRWQSVISSLPRISKEQYTYFSLWLLRYISSYYSEAYNVVFCVAFSVIADRIHFAYKYRQENKTKQKKKEYTTCQSKNKEDTKSTTRASEFREFSVDIV